MIPKVGQYWLGTNSRDSKHMFVRKVVSINPGSSIEHRAIGYISWSSGGGGGIGKENEGVHIYHHSFVRWEEQKEEYFIHPIPEEKALMLIQVWSCDLPNTNPV